MLQHENLEEVLHQIFVEGYNPDSPYDHVVLFSGGKDSTYIAHRLRQVHGGRVCLFTVDNGFENPNHIENLKKVASKLRMDLYLYVPPADEMIKFYNFLITENLLKTFDSNPVCFFCARYFMALGLEFADRMNIPFVSYGATPTQLTGNKLARTIKDIELFESASRLLRDLMQKKISTLDRYINDAGLRMNIDKIFYAPKKAKLVYPFQYTEYNISNMLNVLKSEYGWNPPSQKLSAEEYLTSGCELLELIYSIASKRGFIMHEPDQIEKDFANGLMNEKAYTFNKRLFDEMLKAPASEQVRNTAITLGIKHLID